MHPLFISYRRSDSEAYTGRVYDRLVQQFGREQVFKDVDAIPLGMDFRTHLRSVIANCRAVVAVIGTHWLNACDASGARRLESGDDFVRIELEAALARGIPVIPVLVSGAAMPAAQELPEELAAFAYRQCIAVRPDPDFHRDVDRLIGSLQGVLAADAAPAGGAVMRAPPESTRRSNLPKNLPALIGRAPLLARAVADISAQQLLTLVGFGGTGKTRLAQQIGLEVGARFADGVWFVDLAALSATADVLPVIARQVGVREDSSESLEVTLIGSLCECRMLLILDGCERFTQAIAAFIEQLLAAAPQVHVLCTSREPLGVYGESVIRVAGLEEQEATALFAARAAQVRSGVLSEREAVGELCRRLDFVPLAIELAAAHVRSLSPRELLARLGAHADILRATDRRTARHQTLESLVAWSYDLLSEAEQHLLNRLGVFVGSFDLTSCERVCAGGSITVEAVVTLLDRLVDKSLVAIAASQPVTRYRLLESVRQFAAARLAGSGEQDEYFDRHVRYYSSQAQSLGVLIRDATRTTSGTLLSEIDNLNAALDRLGDHGQHTEKAALVVALNLFWQLNTPATGRKRFEELMAIEKQIAPEMRMLAQLEAASFYANLGLVSQALALLERTRATARTQAIELPPYFYYVAAAVAEMDARAAEALSLCEQGLAVVQPGDDFSLLSLRARALTSILKLRPAEALAHARETLELARTHGMDLFVSVGHMLIGTVLMVEGRSAESEPEFVRAIELAGEAMPQVTISAFAACAAAQRSADPERSIACAHEALAVEGRAGDIMPWFRVVAATLLAWHWADGGRAEEATLTLAAMDALRQRLGFAGIWWAQSLRDEAWDKVRRALPAERVQALAARGAQLATAEVRGLLGLQSLQAQ